MFFSLLFFRTVGNNTGKEIFDIDYDRIQSELTELNQLEAYVIENQSVTLSEMQAQNHILSLNISNTPAMFPSIEGTMADIPAFLWGFCLGPIGVIVVWIIDDDDLLMSVVGCLVSSFLFGGGYLLVQ